MELAIEIDVESALVVAGTAVLVADLGEKGGEAVEIALIPAFERMIVAARAADRDAEEELAGFSGEVEFLFHQRVVVCRGLIVHVAAGGEQVATN